MQAPESNSLFCPGKRKKQWADLDAEGFEEKEGIVAGDQVSDTESVADDNNEEGNQDQQWVDNNQVMDLLLPGVYTRLSSTLQIK